MEREVMKNDREVMKNDPWPPKTVLWALGIPLGLGFVSAMVAWIYTGNALATMDAGVLGFVVATFVGILLRVCNVL